MDNKELDKWLAENVMGWGRDGDWWKNDLGLEEYPIMEQSQPHDIPTWHPTKSISQAFQVADKIVELKSFWYSISRQGRIYFCTFYEDAGIGEWEEENADRCMAICLAAKKAVEHSVKGG